MDAAPWARNHPDAAAVSPGGEPPPSAGRPGAALPRGPHGVPPVPRTAPSAALKPDASSAAAAGPHRAIHCPARASGRSTGPSGPATIRVTATTTRTA